MLEDYIESCDVVVHFAGEMAGSAPASSSVDDLLRRRPELAARLTEKGMDREALGRLTYTQWEAWLAIGFNKDGARTQSRHRDARLWRETRRKIRARRGFARVPGRPSRTAQGDRLSIPRNRSPALTILSRAFLGPLFWTPSRRRDRSRSPAIFPSRRSAACSPAATRTLPTCIQRCWAPRALRSRLPVSGGSARRGSRSNMRGLARRSIRRFCSSARATAPHSTRVWRG